MADISNIKVVERNIEIKNPATSALLGITIGLVSVDDEKLKTLRRRIDDRSQKLAAKGKAFSAEELEDNTNEIAFTAMNWWKWEKDADGEEATYHGEKPELNRRNAFAIFKEIGWFRTQITAALNEEEAFFAKSQTT